MTVTCESTLFESLFDVQGYNVVSGEKVYNEEGSGYEVFLDLEAVAESSCPKCGSSGKCYDSTVQTFYLGSVLCKPVYGRLRVYRIDCEECGILTEKQGISDGKKRYSKAVPSMLLEYTKLMDNAAAASLLGLSRSTVYRIDYNELGKRLEDYAQHVPQLERVAVDEVAHKKGHSYATIITNQLDGKVVWVEGERKEMSLINSYDKFKDSFSTLKVATMDFWKPYEHATRLCHPSCKIVYDRFHLSRILNRAIEEERRAYQRELPRQQRKYFKKRMRWILLRRQHNLNPFHKDRLQALKEQNDRLYELYLLKEDFLSIFDDETVCKEQARKQITNWVEMVTNKDFPYLKRFGKNLTDRLENVLSWFDYRISNGKAEGVNNLIKSILKRGYGYKDFHYFRLKVLQRCGYLMTATHTL